MLRFYIIRRIGCAVEKVNEASHPDRNYRTQTNHRYLVPLHGRLIAVVFSKSTGAVRTRPLDPIQNVKCNQSVLVIVGLIVTGQHHLA